ncbi:MAG: thioredoxin family protein [Ignavibacteriae bacterium]|nr:thioredoxin family protein [Ignavibacteriota bacterium]
MKRYLSATLLFLFGCATTQQPGNQQSQSEKMALGWLTRADFVNHDYPKFQENYDSASISPDFVEMIKSFNADIDVIVVLGTWCGDSKRQVPRFLKIVDQVGIPQNRIRYYGVDRTKKSADGVADQYQIEKVPTFIFFHAGREIGRIIEGPRTTMEEEMMLLFAGGANR